MIAVKMNKRITIMNTFQPIWISFLHPADLTDAQLSTK